MIYKIYHAKTLVKIVTNCQEAKELHNSGYKVKATCFK